MLKIGITPTTSHQPLPRSRRSESSCASIMRVHPEGKISSINSFILHQPTFTLFRISYHDLQDGAHTRSWSSKYPNPPLHPHRRTRQGPNTTECEEGGCSSRTRCGAPLDAQESDGKRCAKGDFGGHCCLYCGYCASVEHPVC